MSVPVAGRQIWSLLLMEEILHQLRLVVYPFILIIYRVLAPSQVVGNGISEPSTVSTVSTPHQLIRCFSLIHPDRFVDSPSPWIKPFKVRLEGMDPGCWLFAGLAWMRDGDVCWWFCWKSWASRDLHPGKWSWSLKITSLNREIIRTKLSFVGSIFIFMGVFVFATFDVWVFHHFWMGREQNVRSLQTTCKLVDGFWGQNSSHW